jgi:7-carboxy-7-deazaguanine synthase
MNANGHRRPDQLKINEIFLSVQGEGSRAGRPCTFVRLHGCGLRCSWCDTPYALDHRTGGRWVTHDEVLKDVRSRNARFVEFTGGEPLEQPSVHHVARALLDEGYDVAFETGGHIDIGACDPRAVRIVDFKAPASGMEKRNRYENIDLLRTTDEVKIVCASISDYEWARDLIREHDLTARVGSALISPAFGLIDPQILVEAILRDGLDVRFQLQMHKFVWDPETRGV